MGILNVTEDSFYDGGEHFHPDKAIARGLEMANSGADIIDIGAFSSRPGAELISPAVQLARLKPVVKTLSSQLPDIPLSIDTYSALVVKELAEITSFIVNDISASQYDSELLATVAKLNLPYVLMHMRGTPKTMGDMADYKDVTFSVLTELAQKLHLVKRSGIKDVIIDPGFGFAKKKEHNFELLAKLNALNIFEAPILVGLSRKSMIYKTLGISADEALNGTTALHMIALQNGAQILRVHDVKEAVETRNLWSQLHTPVND